MQQGSKKTIISVSGLTKTYQMGDVIVNALMGVDLDIYEGEFLAVMGASGSGKSTFMNIIGCLDKPSKGKYLLDGVDVSTLNRNELATLRNEKIGFVFQSYNLLARTSALENVELPLLYNNKYNSKQRREKCMEALKSVGLAERYQHMPNQMSGGQQQRVAIARALVSDPVVILADEATGNLDTRTSVEVMEIFQDLNAKGKTIVFVTHEPDIARFMNVNVVFKDGRLERRIVIDKPKNAKEELAKMPVLIADAEAVKEEKQP